jgi:hypothetical protein
MAQDHPAAVLGAADSQIASGRGAHDMMHGADSQGREASRETTQAMKAASLYLESSTIDGTLFPPNDVGVHPSHLQDSSHDVLATGKNEELCVTTTAHDTTKSLVNPLNGNGELNRGKMPNEFFGMCARLALLC